MTEALIALIGVLSTLLLGFVGAVIKMMRERGPVQEANPHPDQYKSGDMSTSYWDLRYARLGDKMDMMNDRTADNGRKLDRVVQLLERVVNNRHPGGD
jgi:hypothetical protein